MRGQIYLVNLDWTEFVYATSLLNRFYLAWRMSRRWANRHFTFVCPWFYTPILLLKGTGYPGSEANQGGLNPQHCLSGQWWIFCEIYVPFNKAVEDRKEPSFSQLYLVLPPGSVAAGRCQHLSWSLHRRVILELCENGRACSHSGNLQQYCPRPAEHWLCYHSHR